MVRGMQHSYDGVEGLMLIMQHSNGIYWMLSVQPL